MAQRPKDTNPADPDKPVQVPTAADHRPDRGDDGSGNTPPQAPPAHEGRTARGENQNDLAKQAPDSQIHKRQRSQGMNRSERKPDRR